MSSKTLTIEQEAAQDAGLRYSDLTAPGITRRRAGTGFSYRDPNDVRITRRDVIVRIRALVIPPAWTDVWISPSPNGHIQATGRDAKNRKQYRYHARWNASRNEHKYERLLDFAKVLPTIRTRVTSDLRKHGLPRDKVLATIVQLLESTTIRIGSDEYAKSNKSFGLTTMRDRHVEVRGSRLEFSFRGKSGIEHEIDLDDRQMAAIVKRCQELPGQHLFQYIDDAGKRQGIDSSDVNAYLKDISGENFTAKDFRTWAGSVIAAQAFAELDPVESETAVKRNVNVVIDAVAARLGNTRAVCRKWYVHPVVIDAYLNGATLRAATKDSNGTWPVVMAGLEPDEIAMLTLIERGLTAPTTVKE